MFWSVFGRDFWSTKESEVSWDARSKIRKTEFFFEQILERQISHNAFYFWLCEFSGHVHQADMFETTFDFMLADLRMRSHRLGILNMWVSGAMLVNSEKPLQLSMIDVANQTDRLREEPCRSLTEVAQRVRANAVSKLGHKLSNHRRDDDGSWSSSWHVWKSTWWVYGVYGILPPQEAWPTPKSQGLREFVAGAVWSSLGLWRHLPGQLRTRRWQRMQVRIHREEGMERQTVADVFSLPEKIPTHCCLDPRISTEGRGGARDMHSRWWLGACYFMALQQLRGVHLHQVLLRQRFLQKLWWFFNVEVQSFLSHVACHSWESNI